MRHRVGLNGILLLTPRGSLPHKLFILAIVIFYIFQLVTFAMSLPRLVQMYRFYTHLLGIPDVSVHWRLQLTSRWTYRPCPGLRSYGS